MIRSSKEPDLTAKQEAETSDGKISKVTSTSWSKLKDPRIVRASRAFGGKDRHSKVSTVRGLRDRRVRLSVPTAIQLYDLQDRLGFNQPSKVVDWLLDAAKHEIDELPPLPIHPSNFTLNHQPVLASRAAGAPQSKITSSINWDHLLDLSRPNIWSSEAAFKHKSKEIARETTADKDNSSEENEEEKPSDPQGHAEYASPSNNFFPITNHSSFQGLLNNVLQCNSFLRWDPSNLSLSHPGSQGLTSQAEDVPNFNAVPMPFGATQPYFPSHATAAAVQLDSRQSDFHMLRSSSQNLLSNSLVPSLYPPHQTMRPFQLTMKPKYLFSLNHGGSETNKDTKE